MVSATRDVEGDRAPAGAASGRSDRRGLRIAVVGSSTLQAIPWALWEYLMEGTPRDATVLLRRGMYAAPGRFERLCRELVQHHATHLQLRWCMPDPDDGPGAAFIRDNEMVSRADLVLAFFDPQNVMTGGTGHVVETAIDRGVPVYSFTIDDEGLTRVGEHDPDAIWQETLGAYF